jgi:hypothetical protein
MGRRVKIVLFVAVSNLILSAYYLLVGLKLRGIYSELDANVPNPLFNKYFAIYLIFSLLSFIYGYYLQSEAKQGREIGKISHTMFLLFISAPLIFLVLSTTYYIITILMLYDMTTTLG